MAEALEEEFKKALQEALKEAKTPQKKKAPLETAPLPSTPYFKAKDDFFRPIQTGVPAQTLQSLAERFCAVPDGFSIHPET